MNNKQFFAEVIEGDLSQWTGQCWNWNQIPHFGALVTTTQKNITIYGIVHSIKTGSNDPMRTPIPFQKTEEELLRDQPQIFEFLQTTFGLVTVGYQTNNTIFYHLPAQPAKIHSFIAQATDSEYASFFANDQFLHMLFNLSSQISNFDELLLTIIKTLHEKKCLSKNQLTDFVETFSILCKHDYQKLKIFLHRMQHVITHDSL